MQSEIRYLIMSRGMLFEDEIRALNALLKRKHQRSDQNDGSYWRDFVSDPAHKIAVARKDGELIAMCTYMKLDLPSHFQGQFHNIVLPNEGDRVTICEKLIETILQDIHRVPEVLQVCQGRQDPDVIEAFRRHHFLEKDWVVLQRRSNPAKSRAKK